MYVTYSLTCMKIQTTLKHVLTLQLLQEISMLDMTSDECILNNIGGGNNNSLTNILHSMRKIKKIFVIIHHIMLKMNILNYCKIIT